MSVNTDEYIKDYANSMAPKSIRQMPIFSQVGKGIPGDASRLTFVENGADSYLKCTHVDAITKAEEQEWLIPISKFMPMLRCETWVGVRTITQHTGDDVNMWVYYIRFIYSINISGKEHIIWTFDTPWTQTRPFLGGTIPADSKVEG